MLINPLSDNQQDPRYRAIIEQIFRWSEGDFSEFLPISDARDQVDSISVALNMLGEELREKTVSKDALEVKNEELRKINAELDRLVFNVSHNLRGPLANVLGLTNLAMDEEKVGLIRHYLQMQKSAINKIDQIVYDIVNYSQNIKQELEFSRVDWGVLVREVASEKRFPELGRQVDFQLHLGPSSDFYSDSNRLDIILNNLLRYCLTNKADTEAQSLLRLNIRNDETEATLILEDNDQKIKEETLSHLFELLPKDQDLYAESGLGLYIVKECVEDLGGDIEALPMSGKGLRFVVSLPNKMMDSSNS